MIPNLIFSSLRASWTQITATPQFFANSAGKPPCKSPRNRIYWSYSASPRCMLHVVNGKMEMLGTQNIYRNCLKVSISPWSCCIRVFVRVRYIPSGIRSEQRAHGSTDGTSSIRTCGSNRPGGRRHGYTQTLVSIVSKYRGRSGCSSDEPLAGALAELAGAAVPNRLVRHDGDL